jgi:hypothetical protein
MYLWKRKEKKKAHIATLLGPTQLLQKKKKRKTRCVSPHCGLAIYNKNCIFKAKEELWKLKYIFHHAKI